MQLARMSHAMNPARFPPSNLSFVLPLDDAGAGAVNLAPLLALGSATPTFTRATAATTISSAGLIIPVSSGIARSYFDPTTLKYGGYLPEGARTNLVLNSLIDGTNFSTQSVTVTAVAHTLSFYGTGTITLSGVSTAGPLVGTGVYPQRVSLTFTPTAGSLTLTVTGSCKFVQLEIGAFASSFIPTAGVAVARNADVLTYASAGNFLNTAGSIYGEVSNPDLDTGSRRWFGSDAVGTSRIEMTRQSGGFLFNYGTGAAFETMGPVGTPVANTIAKHASSWGSNGKLTAQGLAAATDAVAPAIGQGTVINIGAGNSGLGPFFGTIKNVRIWNTQLSDADLQALTA